MCHIYCLNRLQNLLDACHLYVVTADFKQQQQQQKLYGPFLWMEFNCLKARVTARSFYSPWKDEYLSQPWSHPVVLNTRPLNWESSVLTTRSLLYKQVKTG